MGSIGTWQLLIVLLVVFVVFGAKRLPEAARGLGRSLKIFKSETEGLMSHDSKDDAASKDTPAAEPQAPRAVEEAPVDPAAPDAERVTDQSRREA